MSWDKWMDKVQPGPLGGTPQNMYPQFLAWNPAHFTVFLSWAQHFKFPSIQHVCCAVMGAATELRVKEIAKCYQRQWTYRQLLRTENREHMGDLSMSKLCTNPDDCSFK